MEFNKTPLQSHRLTFISTNQVDEDISITRYGRRISSSQLSANCAYFRRTYSRE